MKVKILLLSKIEALDGSQQDLCKVMKVGESEELKPKFNTFTIDMLLETYTHLYPRATKAHGSKTLLIIEAIPKMLLASRKHIRTRP